MQNETLFHIYQAYLTLASPAQEGVLARVIKDRVEKAISASPVFASQNFTGWFHYTSKHFIYLVKHMHSTNYTE